MIAVDQDEARPNTEERSACGLVGVREARREAGKLDRCTQERSGEWIGGKDEHGVAAHVVILAGGNIASRETTAVAIWRRKRGTMDPAQRAICHLTRAAPW